MVVWERLWERVDLRLSGEKGEGDVGGGGGGGDGDGDGWDGCEGWRRVSDSDEMVDGRR